MKIEEYKKRIIELLEDIGEADQSFIIQIYTIVKHHINKKRRR